MNSNNRIFKYMAMAAALIVIVFFLILLFAGRRKSSGVQTESNSVSSVNQATVAENALERAVIETGKQIYLQQCASCHGDNGGGDGPLAVRCVPAPADFASGKLKYGSSPEEIFKSISDGIKGTMMASYGFIEEKDRWAVTHYIRTLMPENEP